MKNDHSWIYKHFDRVEKNIDVVKVYSDIEMFYRSQGCQCLSHFAAVFWYLDF